MAKCLWWIAFVVCFCSSFVLCSNVFDSILDDDEPCKSACLRTYPLHTYPNPGHVECCKRGCRFFTLVSFLHDGDKVNASRDACMASCMEAYSRTDDRYACNIGCSNQQLPPAVVQHNQETTKDEIEEDESSSVHFLTPFMYVHNIYNNVLDHMCRMMSVSWSVYLQQDDGKVVVLQSEPEIITEYLDMEDIEDKNKDDNDDLTADDSSLTPVSGQPVSQQPSKTMPDIYYYHHRQLIGGDSVPSSSLDDDVPVRITVSAYASEEVQSVDWLGCVSRKSGLPRWLLGVIIFFSAMVMVWLCFATSATAPEHHVKPQVVSFCGDVDYLKSKSDVWKNTAINVPYNRVVEEKPTEEGGRAPPLPSKDDDDELLQRLVV